WLFARKVGGQFWLRFDDTDLVRSEARYATAIEADLAWLGLNHDSSFRQSDRLDRYGEVKEQLIKDGRLYPCFETPEELDFKRKRQVARGEPPLYDRAALKLTDAEKQAFAQEGRIPHWRFLLKDQTIAWDDMVRGPVSYQSNHLGDPVLVRGDRTYLYTFTSVVDDLDFAITHIVRGEHHVTNTATQLQIFEALQKQPTTIQFAHTSLLVDATGHGLSKRIGSLSLQSLREDGVEAMSVNSFLARLGTSLPIEPRATLQELVDDFDLSTFSRTPPRFDIKELMSLNRKLLQLLPYETVENRLKDLGADLITAPVWSLIRNNLDTLKDALNWQDICFSTISPQPHDQDFMSLAQSCLPPEPWSEDTWKQWTESLKELSGRKGKELYAPLRLSLTGLPYGPEMKDLLLIIGRARVCQRLGA
ncbi:MAG: glutamate--tRNA ligase, partial [Alphaproteobacteria bacterium]